jgi:hypothetical protein
MIGKIVRTEIGLGFSDVERNAPACEAAHKRPADEIARNYIRRPVEESGAKNRGGFRLSPQRSWMSGAIHGPCTFTAA